MNNKIAVVILNWNGKYFLEKFLPGVIKNSNDIAEIIIVDNASTDDSVKFLQNNYPQIRIIRNAENEGFAKGYNDALMKIDANYYILLNSDIEVTENWIKPVIDLMETDKKIAVCQPKLRSFNEPSKFEYAGAAGGFIDKYGYPFCRGRLFQSIEQDNGQYDDVAEIFWATGACMFVRADLYHQFGGLDNDFFAHMEEIDFCWRVKNKGYKIMYCPNSTVFHIGGGTLPKKSARKTYLNMRNNNIMLLKNLPDNRLIKVFIARLFLDGIAALKFLFDGGFKDFFAVIKAHFSFYSSLSKIRKKRRETEHINVSKIYGKNIVFEHFLKSKKKFTQLNSNKFS
ncbi:MAG: glycosyltransferase family 2 protein [Bacteroidales bacterium]|nr:glycosyltransferase family 2 protein [Bacteroidales bacterium]